MNVAAFLLGKNFHKWKLRKIDRDIAKGIEQFDNYAKNIIFRARMEKECSIICLIYIERVIQLTGLYLNKLNWKRVLFISLTIASKVWDDESYENVHFAKVFTRYPLKEINTLERIFLSLIDYNVGIKKSEYAKYYFILRAYSTKESRTQPLKAFDVDTVRKLQLNGHKAGPQLRTLRSGMEGRSIS